MQVAPDGKEHVLAYASRTTMPNERNWSTTEQEAGAVIWALEKFRPYLIDIPFKCRTDHANLKWIRQSSKGRLIHWALKLDEYDMTLEPRPGIKMPHVDALSRYLVECKSADEYHLAAIPHSQEHQSILPSEQLSVIQWAQRNDAECQNIYQAVKHGSKAYSHLLHYVREKQFHIQDHTIYYKTEHREVPFVPAALRQRLLYEYHAGTCAAHLGSKKVLGALKRKYFWPSMTSDVYTYVHGCMRCLRRKGCLIMPVGPVQLPKGAPFQIVASDIFGPLPTTSRGNRFVLVFIDHFTKWPVIIPASAITAEHFVKYFHDHWITTFGCPSRLLTDGGPQFIADVTKVFCDKYNISKTVSTAYHPQSNGIAEVFMKVLGHSLSILTRYNATNWDLHCTTIAFAYHTTIHPKIANTPAYLALGFDPKLPVDCDIEAPSGTTDTDKRLKYLAMWRGVAKGRLEAEAEIETTTHNTIIHPGMLVVYKLQIQEAKGAVAHKLLPRFSTPWLVVKQLDNTVTYEIRHLERRETKLINRDRLAIFTPNTGQYNVYDLRSPPRPFAQNTQAEPATTTPVIPDQASQDAETEPASTSTPQASDAVLPVVPAPPPVAPTRQLRTTVERQSRVGDPMSWQYKAGGAASS